MYQEAVAAIGALPGITLDSEVLPADKATAPLAISSRNTAVVALGNRASTYVAQQHLTVPVVHCMVSGDSEPSAASVRVPLVAPASMQAQWLRRLLPEARTLAILYTPAQNADTATAMARELGALGFHVISAPVDSAAELPQALRRIGKADALLAIPDAVVYSPELARGLLLFTYRTRTPLIAYSQAWVRAGALYALDWPPATLGRYCGMLALAMLTTAPNATLPPPPPAPRVSVNPRVAAQLGLAWSAADLSGVETLSE